MQRIAAVTVCSLCLALGGCWWGDGDAGDSPRVSISASSTSEDLPPAATLTKGQAEETLYAAYAGIGCMQPDDPADDEALYGIMFDDLNSLMGSLTLLVIENGNLSALGNLMFGQTAVLSIEANGVSVTLSVQPTEGDVFSGQSFALHLNLGAQFEEQGHATGGVTYSATPGRTAFMADIDLDYDVDAGGEVSVTLPQVRLRTDNTLMADYGDDTAGYAGWSIAYELGEDRVNARIVPQALLGLLEIFGIDAGLEESPDHRLYTLEGTFSLAGAAYTFNDMRYGQYDAREVELDEEIPPFLLAMTGEVGSPSLEGTDVQVSSPLSGILAGGLAGLDPAELDPADLAHVIMRDAGGTWTGGECSISATDNTVDIAFIDGAALFVSSTSPEAPWVINLWQDILDPLP